MRVGRCMRVGVYGWNSRTTVLDGSYSYHHSQPIRNSRAFRLQSNQFPCMPYVSGGFPPRFSPGDQFALEFANDGVFLLIFIRFWREDSLCRVFLKRAGRTQGESQAEVNQISHVMGALPTKPHIISITGSTSCTVQLLDKSPYRTTQFRVLPVLRNGRFRL